MKAPHFGYVDALRGLAILMVIVSHTVQAFSRLDDSVQNALAFGQTGVQLFFVASALTLCVSYAARIDEGSRNLKFWLRRLFRIAPLYYLAIVLNFAIAGIKSSTGWLNSGVEAYTTWNVVANLLFVHAWVPSAANSVVPGGWSIGVEMAFYLMFPWLFLALRRCGPLRAVCLLAGFIVAHVVASAWVFGGAGGGAAPAIPNNSFAYFALINQLPAFACGMMVYFILASPGGRPGGLARWRASAGFVLFFALALWLWFEPPRWAFGVLPAACGAAYLCLVLLASRARTRWMRLEAIGRVSFSMYVLHIPFAGLAMRALVRWGPQQMPHEVLLAIGLPFVVLASYACARLAARWVERPGIELGRRVVCVLDERMARRAALRAQRA